MIKTGDKVVVERIIDQFKGDHLVDLIGREGTVISWLVYQHVKRFKVQFQNGLEFISHYFREDELRKVEEGE